MTDGEEGGGYLHVFEHCLALLHPKCSLQQFPRGAFLNCFHPSLLPRKYLIKLLTRSGRVYHSTLSGVLSLNTEENVTPKEPRSNRNFRHQWVRNVFYGGRHIFNLPSHTHTHTLITMLYSLPIEC